MIGASFSFSFIQACLPGPLSSRAFPSFSLLTKRIPTDPQDSTWKVLPLPSPPSPSSLFIVLRLLFNRIRRQPPVAIGDIQHPVGYHRTFPMDVCHLLVAPQRVAGQRVEGADPVRSWRRTPPHWLPPEKYRRPDRSTATRSGACRCHRPSAFRPEMPLALAMNTHVLWSAGFTHTAGWVNTPSPCGSGITCPISPPVWPGPALPAQVVQVEQAQQAIFTALQPQVGHVAARRRRQDRHGGCTQVLVGHVQLVEIVRRVAVHGIAVRPRCHPGQAQTPCHPNRADWGRSDRCRWSGRFCACPGRRSRKRATRCRTVRSGQSGAAGRWAKCTVWLLHSELNTRCLPLARSIGGNVPLVIAPVAQVAAVGGVQVAGSVRGGGDAQGG